MSNKPFVDEPSKLIGQLHSDLDDSGNDLDALLHRQVLDKGAYDHLKSAAGFLDLARHFVNTALDKQRDSETPRTPPGPK